MDPGQFDDLVAKISNALTRREAVKGLSVGALTSAGLGAVAAESGDAAKKKGDGKKDGGGKKRRNGKKGRDDDKKGDGGADAEGNKRRRRRRRRKNKKCKPQAGQTRCSKKVCVDLQTNFENCGNCGNSCLTGQFCKDGSCRNAT